MREQAVTHSTSNGLSAALLVVAALPSAFATVAHVDGWPLLTGSALAFYFIAQWRQLPGSIRALLAVCIGVAAYVIMAVEAPWPFLLRGAEKACFYAAFFTAIGFMREASDSSAMVLNCGRFLINQPPGHRYIILSLGAHLFGIILNLGAVTLLGTMIRRSNTLAAAGGSETVRAVRERRMSVALLRGFMTTPVSSPLGIAMTVILTSIPGVTWFAVAPYCVGMAVGFILLGWLHDRLTRPTMLPVPPPDPERDGWALAKMMGLVLFVSALAAAVAYGAGCGLSGGVVVAAVVTGIAWMVWQNIDDGVGRALRTAGRKLFARAPAMFAGYRAEIGVLSSAGFIAAVAPAVIDPVATEMFLGRFDLHGPAVAILLSWVVIAAAQVGVNPVLSVAVIATTLAHPEAFGLSKTYFALALFGTWGVAPLVSPTSATVTVLSAINGRSSAEMCYRWNGSFFLAAVVVLDLGLWLFGR